MVKINLARFKDKIKLPRFFNKRFWTGFLFAFSFFVLLLCYFLFIVWQLKSPAQAMVNSVKTSFDAVQAKDLDAAEANLQLAQKHLSQVQTKFNLIGWARFIPFFGGYIKDGQHSLTAAKLGLETGSIFIEAIKPYADVLGFSGAEEQEHIQSAEEKIMFILETLDKISPQLDSISEKVALIEAELSQINPRRYPQNFRGRAVRQQLISLQQALAGAKETLINIKPLLALMPRLLGQPDAQRYLLLFQNNAELRPSGGFLTAYAILETYRGKITPLLSKDIYELDARFDKRLPAPEPIKKYLPLVYSWHLRDMNLSPDFKISMDTFAPNYKSVASIKDINGIIAVDTQVPVDLLQVLGEIGVAKWGNYSAEIIPECNCPQVVYKLEDYATRPTYYIKENRKGMIGPLMHSILLNVMNSPRKLWPQFVNIGLNNIKQKHLMFYFFDQEMQQVAENFNAAGRLKDYSGDYFHLNDANFAGAKSNLYVNQKVDQEIQIQADGSVVKTVTVTYTNPEPPDDCNLESGGLCLNGILRDWVRFYVPEGSQLIEMLGSEVEPVVTKDLGKTVFEGFFELRPQSKAKLIVKYKLPFKLKQGEAYRLLIQKQPGTKNYQYTVTVGNKVEEFNLDSDRELTL
jgi:hypothetical protein